MHFPESAGPASDELATFVSALSEVFHDEQWDDIESYAERAWMGCGFADDNPWEEVKARIQLEWGERLDHAICENRRLRSVLQSRMQEARRRADELAATIEALDKLSKWM